jgi:hypothetical protein
MITTLYRGLLTAFLIFLAFAVGPGPAFASHSWGPYHWARTRNPFTLILVDNVSSAWDSYLVTARNDWTGSSVLDLTIQPGNTGINLRKCPAISGRVRVCNTTYGNNGWLGIAQIWISGSHITQGITKLNDTYFNTSKYNTPAWRRLVMCQEVGHTFGLDHQDEGFNNGNLGTCMDYTNDPDGPPSNEHPNSHDYQQLDTIYKHLDGTNTVGQMVQSGPAKGKMPPLADTDSDTDSDEPVELGTAQWGKLIRSTHRGRTELYELDLGGGHKVLTHVIWAEPEEEQQPGQRRGQR